MVVAEITKDHLFENWRTLGYDSSWPNYKGKQFEFQAMLDWWGWDDLPHLPSEKTTFKLYDDDGELYYEGWLHNDDHAIVQQFVLRWAEVDSGCTTIKVHRPNPVPGEGGGSYVQEIG